MVHRPTSLRERSKAKRRAAIQRAALALFAERGYDGATIADIAEQAELAPRTVTMYFPSKLDLAMSSSADMGGRLTATFKVNPDLPFTEVIDRWLATEAQDADPELVTLTSAMFKANPALRAASAGYLAQSVSVASAALLYEAGLQPEHPLAAVVASAASAALAEYLTVTSRQAAPHYDLRPAFIGCLRNIIKAGTGT